MPSSPVIRVLALAAATLLASGCAHCCKQLDNCPCMEGCEPSTCMEGSCSVGCGAACTPEAPCCLKDCPLCKCCPVRKAKELCKRPEPGPPPIRYRPELPPKFLPVPTQPTISPARPDAPDYWPGDVETHYDHRRLTFEPGD